MQSGWGVVILRWYIYFVPPSLNGSAVGVTFSAAGLVQILAVALAGPALTSMFKLGQNASLVLPACLLGVVGLFFGVLCNIAVSEGSTVPDQPPTIEQIEEVEARRGRKPQALGRALSIN